MYYNGDTMATDTELTHLIKDRILYFMKARDLSFKDLSELSGVSEVGIRNWFPKKNYIPTIPALEKIIQALEIYPYALFCNDEDVMPVSPEDKELLKKIGQLSNKQRAAISELLDNMIDPNDAP